MEKMMQEMIKLDGVLLMIWKLTETLDELKNELHLSDNEFIEFDEIVTDKRKLEYIGVRMAMKELLGKKVSILYDKDGKPYLTDNSYYISISHSKNLIAVMAHSSSPVGIDIECRTDKIKKIYHRFLSETEQKELSGGENVNQLSVVWSAKEVLYKIIGKNAVDFANQLRIFPFEVKPEGEILAEHVPTGDKYKIKYIQNSEYTLAFCQA
jgi:phosphopantetheinyl transferase